MKDGVGEQKLASLKLALNTYGTATRSNRVLQTGYDSRLDGKNVTQDQTTRIQGLVETVRSRFIDLIKRGKDLKDLSLEEQASVHRIETIQLTLPNDPRAYLAKDCDNRSGNAFYSPGAHTLTVCASDLKYPDESLIRTIAHEMGHSIDPCNIQRNLLSNQTSLPGMELKDYPFRSVLACLESDAGGGFRSNQGALDDLQSHAEELLEKLNEGKVLSEDDKKAQLSQLKRIINAKPECANAFLTTQSQMGETMADWFGNEVLNSYLKDHPRQGDAPENQIRPLTFLSYGYCSDRESVTSDQGLRWMLGTVSDPHPNNGKRIDEIALREPEIRKYLGCTGGSSAPKCSRGE